MRQVTGILTVLWMIGMGLAVYFNEAGFAALCGMMFSLFTINELIERS